MKNLKPILVVEDDLVDVMTVKRAFNELRIRNPIQFVHNGEEALEHLRVKSNEIPCFILLDLNMPKMNGLEFLKLIKQDPLFKIIPVVILTTSNDERDKLDSFKLGVSGYMLKSVEYSKFVDVIKTIDGYWAASEYPEGPLI